MGFVSPLLCVCVYHHFTILLSVWIPHLHEPWLRARLKQTLIALLGRKCSTKLMAAVFHVVSQWVDVKANWRDGDNDNRFNQIFVPNCLLLPPPRYPPWLHHNKRMKSMPNFATVTRVPTLENLQISDQLSCHRNQAENYRKKLILWKNRSCSGEVFLSTLWVNRQKVSTYAYFVNLSSFLEL